MNVAELIDFAIASKASDIHLSSGSSPRLRVDGVIVPTQFPAPSGEEVMEVLRQIMPEAQAKVFEQSMDVDFACTYGGMRFRVNAFVQMRGAGAVFRLISSEIPSLEELPAPDVVYKLLGLNDGLILLSGPTGAGKSTTMASMVRYMNETSRRHIITLEDPIEFVHNNDFSLITQREIYQHSHSFSDALQAALREDPDVIMVGEMRSLETVRLALTAAETGHLVIATMHTASAAKAVNRIVDVFPSEEKELVRSMVSESLQAVVLQTLVARKGGGRVAAFEVMLGTPAVRNLIRNDKVPQLHSALQTGKDQGMVTLEHSLEDLVKKGLIEAAVAEKTIASRAVF